MRKMHVAIPEDLYEVLTKRAEELGVRLSDVVRDTLAIGLDVPSRYATKASVAEGLILKGLTNRQLMAEMDKLYPGVVHSPGAVAFYRLTLKKREPATLTDHQAREAQHGKA